MVDLKPCPFCGHADSLYIEHVEGTILHPAYYVRCDNCGAQSASTDTGNHIRNWNERHPQPVTPAGGEVVAYRYVADEGVYNPFVRDWMDGSPDKLDLENIARHPGIRFEFAYSAPLVSDHELQQKWFRRGWDMYVELHGETPPTRSRCCEKRRCAS